MRLTGPSRWCKTSICGLISFRDAKLLKGFEECSLHKGTLCVPCPVFPAALNSSLEWRSLLYILLLGRLVD
jgi:hypothetical protein